VVPCVGPWHVRPKLDSAPGVKHTSSCVEQSRRVEHTCSCVEQSLWVRHTTPMCWRSLVRKLEACESSRSGPHPLTRRIIKRTKVGRLCKESFLKIEDDLSKEKKMETEVTNLMNFDLS
jgi:hypothetical protein